MSTRLLALCLTLAVLTGSAGAAQQGPRTDILTGEPIRPRGVHPGPQPEIFNAPHAPRQEQRRADDPPIDIYVAPQIGTDQTMSRRGAGPPVPMTVPSHGRRSVDGPRPPRF